MGGFNGNATGNLAVSNILQNLRTPQSNNMNILQPIVHHQKSGSRANPGSGGGTQNDVSQKHNFQNQFYVKRNSPSSSVPSGIEKRKGTYSRERGNQLAMVTTQNSTPHKNRSVGMMSLTGSGPQTTTNAGLNTSGSKIKTPKGHKKGSNTVIGRAMIPPLDSNNRLNLSMDIS
jgi:hypothetical protein